MTKVNQESIDNADTGCQIDGWWGVYAIAKLIANWSADDDMLALAERDLDQMGGSPRTLEELTADESVIMMDYVTFQLEPAINDALPIGLCAEWIDGEYYIMDEAMAEELADW